MKEFFGVLLAFVACILLVLGLSWVFMGNDFFMYKYFAPKQAAAQRQVFENTKSFNDGMIQQLNNYFTQYKNADDEGKATIKSVVLHQYSAYDYSRLPQYLIDFMNSLTNQTQF